jgi:large subunit ribosomal protein L17
MRHRKKGSTLNRTQSHRKALLCNMVTSLFQHERIRTTVAKAKEARPLAEKLITFAKRGDLHARRQVLKIVRDKEVVRKLFSALGERFKNRPGGYTRILRMDNRLGDNAPMVLFELMPEDLKKAGGGKRRTRRPKKKEAPAAHEAAVAQAAPAETPVVAETAAGEAPAEQAPVAEAGTGDTEKKE